VVAAGSAAIAAVGINMAIAATAVHLNTLFMICFLVVVAEYYRAGA
jgi:hypothetical protein